MASLRSEEHSMDKVTDFKACLIYMVVYRGLIYIIVSRGCKPLAKLWIPAYKLTPHLAEEKALTSTKTTPNLKLFMYQTQTEIDVQK